MPARLRTVLWWSPDPRGVLPRGSLRMSRSLRRSLGRYEVRVDTAFESVITACADLPRPHGWITRRFVDAYLVLHHLGIAHSVESWTDGLLVGGLYGVNLGGFFAGESMFHTATDASKVALVHLVEGLEAGPETLLDVQWATPHLASLGVTEVSRADYLLALHRALDAPTPAIFSASRASRPPSAPS